MAKGDLGRYWDQLRNMDWDDPRREDVQKNINGIEVYMIKMKWKTDGITQWDKSSNKNSQEYPFHTGFVDFGDISMVGKLNGKGINYNSDNSIHNCQLCI